MPTGTSDAGTAVPGQGRVLPDARPSGFSNCSKTGRSQCATCPPRPASSHPASQQLAVLRRSGIVTATRHGTTVVYALAGGDVAELMRAAPDPHRDARRAEPAIGRTPGIPCRVGLTNKSGETAHVKHVLQAVELVVQTRRSSICRTWRTSPPQSFRREPFGQPSNASAGRNGGHAQPTGPSQRIPAANATQARAASGLTV